MARLEWLCQMKFDYAGLSLGWDGFAWCGDSLAFILPYRNEFVKSIKQICVLGIGGRWWDCESQTLEFLIQISGSESLAKIILEFAGLSWATVTFNYPKTSKKVAGVQQMYTEIIKSGFIGVNNYLILSKMSSEVKPDHIEQKWSFHISMVPATFEHMWKAVKMDKQYFKNKIKLEALGS
ncbi:hypothetical protein RFI_09143 [Reticulomyxa filosa]|uniref:Uncharacterized protein n=1 Tax=Reticulomyxa filosa TaxID=46433 RepID=X6NRN1_RETFI|nr:hypothetical protein RFI_09143 [Reticulomyxa filosa]|eukprot:ETO27987.1 hypothetical protein RFI_09143 [Reticulomyxa filosa]